MRSAFLTWPSRGAVWTLTVTEGEIAWNSEDETIQPCWLWQSAILSDENLRNLGSVPQRLTHMLIFMHNSCVQTVPAFGL